MNKLIVLPLLLITFLSHSQEMENNELLTPSYTSLILPDSLLEDVLVGPFYHVDEARAAMEPVDYVDPYIGSIAPLLKTTGTMVQLPHGMMTVTPVTYPKVHDKYLATRIQGFTMAGFLLMASTGSVQTDPAKFASLIDHDFEIARPYYHAVKLETYDINADYTVTRHAAHYRFAFPACSSAHLLIASRNPGALEVTGPYAVTGYDDFGGTRFYFHAEFSEPFVAFST
jgi:putative alpha-1,2-mannosidase